MIRTPAFWTKSGLTSKALRPISWIYRGLADARMAGSPRYRATVPVIAIGNFTAGGAGKTPTALALTHLAIELGFSPIVLMRGYGGTARGPILVDGSHDTARHVGDEALMIAQAGVPVVVSRDRAAGAAFAAESGSDLILLDDGFQSPALAKDLAFVVVDSVYGVGNGEVIPAGPLRASLDTQYAAMDALVVVSNGGMAGTAATALADRARAEGRPVFSARLEPDEQAMDFNGRRVIAFAGIGRPAKLAEGLAARGALVEELVGFPDHHRFTPAEARTLLARIEGTDRLLVTTAKDMARISRDSDPALRALADRSVAALVRLVFDDRQSVSDFLVERLGGVRALRPAKPLFDHA